MNIKGFRYRTFFHLQRIRLGLIGNEIVSFADAAGLSVHRAAAIAPYIQKKGEGTLDIRPIALMTDRVNDDAGKACCFQAMAAPAQAVVKSAGDLALQPAKVWKFMQDHT